MSALRRHVLALALTGPTAVTGSATFAALAAAEAPAIGWQEAVARLAAERAKAETCAAALKRYGDEAAKAQGKIAYGEAKAEVDGVIGGLAVALAKCTEPSSLP